MHFGKFFDRTLVFLKSSLTKAGFSFLVVYALIYFNKIDSKTFAVLTYNWHWLFCALLCMLPSYAIVSYRFWLVLRNQAIVAPFSLALRWTMIGSLLDIVMPSSSGGDLAKAGFIVRHVGAGKRTYGLMSVAFDRVLGLLGLFLLAGVAGIVALPSVMSLPNGGQLLMFLLAASCGTLVFFRIAGSRRIYGNIRLRAWQEQSWVGDKIFKLVGSFNALREKPLTLIVVLVLSVCNHVFWCASLLLITLAFGHDIDLLLGYALFPLAIFGNVFGFAGGFGLGTVGFDLIFEHFFNIPTGAAIGLTFQTLSGISRLSGLPFYLASPEKRQISEDILPKP